MVLVAVLLFHLIYLTTLSIARIMWRIIIGLLENDGLERMCWGVKLPAHLHLVRGLRMPAAVTRLTRKPSWFGA
jgi:hypothetical protein